MTLKRTQIFRTQPSVTGPTRFRLSGFGALLVCVLSCAGGLTASMAQAASVKIPPVKLKPNEIQALCAYSEGKSTGDINKGYRCDMGAYSKSKQINMRLVCTQKKDCTLQLPDGTAFPENLLPTMKSLLIFVVPAAEFTSFCKKRAGTFKDSGSGYLKCDYKTTAGAFTAYRDNDAVVVFGDAGVLTPKAAHDLFNRKM